MQPQGSAPFNPAYFQALTHQINSVRDCQDLQVLVDEAFASIQAQMSAIAAQLSAITPLLALLEPPKNLLQLIGWIGNFITHFLKPYLKPYVTYALQVAELTIAIAALTEAIQNAAANIQTCSITVPKIDLPNL
jgi:hypothetical protein